MHPKKAILLFEGQDAEEVCVLLQGRAKLTVSTPTGRAVILRIAEAGETLGLSAVLLNQAHDATVQALEPVEALHIARSTFLRCLYSQKGVLAQVLRQLSAQVDRANKVVLSLSAAGTTRARLAGFLIELADREGLATEAGLSFHMNFTHGEIGGMIGTSRETVNRLLSQFRSQGLVRTQGTLVSLPAPDQLRVLLT